jgi:arylsulfatase A-like enzyme
MTLGGAVDQAVFDFVTQGLWTSVTVALGFTSIVLLKSLSDFTRTGPEMADEILSHYRLYLAYALARLGVVAFLICLLLAFAGGMVYVVLLILVGDTFRPAAAGGVSLLAIVVLTGRRFLHTLLFSPGVIAASSHYSTTHLYPIWDRLTPERLRRLDLALLIAIGAWYAAGLMALALQGAWAGLALLCAIALVYAVGIRLATANCEPDPVRRRQDTKHPNILMIGSDTLRADRLNGMGYRRSLTPNLEKLISRGTHFTDCYVPCARTAPSIVSMLTGTWPHRNRIRDTFVTPEEARLPVPALPTILKQAGYRSAIVGDWAASDAEKFSFGFDYKDLPQDQWNIKYLLRQGPKDLRLFVSLFTQNVFGKTVLPEVYYLGGIPLTEEVGCDTRRMIRRLAMDDAPFFLMSFMATTHPPFTSKHPYYSMYADPAYRGESKFIMAKLRDPWEIIRRQGEPRSEFDLEQIIDLYDGCVRNFDDEVARVLDYLEASDLAKNTIVVVFSDHGFEFFEHETWGQGNSAIGDYSARVPIIVADPRIPQPERVSDVVRTVDIAPTLLELVGVPIPDAVEGVSLARLLRGETLGTDLPAFYETGMWLTDLPGSPDDHLRYPELPELLEVPDKRAGTIALKREYLDIVIAAKDRMVRKGKWKLTYQPLSSGVVYRLFDIEQDPGCRRNVIDLHPEVACELRSLMEAWMDNDPLRAAAARESDAHAATPTGAVERAAALEPAYSKVA